MPNLSKVQQDIDRGDLEKARDRLHGLISSDPDNLEFRAQLGEIYWQMHMPAMAGRYWYMVESKDDRMVEACRRFEKQCGNDPLQILMALKFKGAVDQIQDTYAGKTLTALHQQAKEKYSWYEDFRARGAAKYYHRKEKESPANPRKTRLIKWILLLLLFIMLLFMCAGVFQVFQWIF